MSRCLRERRVMSPRRLPRLLAVTLLAAGASLLAAGPAGAATTGPPPPSPSEPGPPDPATPPIGPTGPAGLRIAAVSTGSVVLAWSPALPGNHPIARYEISYNQAFNDIFWMQQAAPDATTLTITTG